MKSRLTHVTIKLLMISQLDQLYFVNITEAVKYSPCNQIVKKAFLNAFCIVSDLAIFYLLNHFNNNVITLKCNHPAPVCSQSDPSSIEIM